MSDNEIAKELTLKLLDKTNLSHLDSDVDVKKAADTVGNLYKTIYTAVRDAPKLYVQS